MKRIRTLGAGGAIALAAGAVAIAGLWWHYSSPSMATSAAASTATAEVTRGTLRDTKIATGTLSYGDLSTLRTSFTDASAMVTWVAPAGATVARGEPLYRLDGQPTILFYGPQPQSRTLRFDPGAASPVWVELEQARRAVEAAELTLRLQQERLRDTETRATDNAARLEDARSSSPATAEAIQLEGAISAAEAKLGRVRELAAAQLTPTIEIASAESELVAARAAFDSAIRALGRDEAQARLDAATARVAAAEAEAKLDEMRTALEVLVARAAEDSDARQIAENLGALGYEGEIADQIRAWQRDTGLPISGIVGPNHLVVTPGPVHIAAHRVGIGETIVAASSDAGAILDYSSTEKLVTVPLAVADQGLAAVGRPVRITLPDDTEVDGTISEVGSVVTEGTIDVSIAVADQLALAGLEVASVDVEFVSDSRDDVLSVPVAALLARPEGGFAVELMGAGASELVPVDTGLFAAGRVEISGEGIAAGMRVGVPG